MSYFNRQKFVDETLFIAAEEYLENYINNAFPKCTQKSINDYRTRIISAVTTYFGDVLLKTIDKEFLLSIYTKLSLVKRDTLIFNRFLLHLISKGYITDMIEVKYIVPYRDRLENYSAPADMVRILTSNYMEKFLQNGLLDTKDSRDICLTNINKDDFIDERLYSLFSDHIDNLKLNPGSAIKSIENICFYAKAILKQMFSDVYLEDITKEYIHNKLNTLSDSLRSSYISEITKGLIFLIDKGVITDNDVVYFKELKQHFINCTNRKSLKSVFAADTTHKFKVISTENRIYRNSLVYFNIASESIREVFADFTVQYCHYDTPFVTVCKEFDKSLSGYSFEEISDLNFNTYIAQIHYFSQYKLVKYIAPITAFYLFIYQNYNQEIFRQDNIDPRLLQRPSLTSELLDGYKIVLYNPIENIPEADKWLLCYSGMEDTNTAITSTASSILDFSRIICTKYRNWVKHYVWKSSAGIYFKTHSLHYFINFFNYIYNLKLGKELSIYAKKTTDLSISINEIIAYKNYILNKYENNRTRMDYIYYVRSVLNHIVDFDLDVIAKGLFYHLSFTIDNRYDNISAITDKDLKKLAILMKSKAEESIEYALYYSIFYISLETEFRGSQICTLTTNCAQETSKPNEYIIISKTKVSAGEEVEQPITIYVKKHIDEIIRITNDFRVNCVNTKIKQYIFLIPGMKKGTYKLLSPNNVNLYLKRCCRELGIKEYTLKNLRDTHMTKAEEFVIRNSLSEIEQSVLTGHKSSNTDTKHYIDKQIKELLESVHGVIIGNVRIDGKIVKEIPKDIATKENLVSNGCGYCSSSYCNIFGFLDCLLCGDFITTIDRIPYFIEQIKMIDKKIENAIIKHDKEDFFNIKLLLINYLKELLRLKGEDFIE